MALLMSALLAALALLDSARLPSTAGAAISGHSKPA
jgi:hypothetical protein